ncbi:Alcohol dehydrogenase zinc-binding domain protein [Cellulomonas flavigena DSM 20109]|uniref:Alcohol dehydrogenase zinc-binding domain protein n=1 Tax=Cellulomonas flavigena (strain ATCC 482 / DSM 20109 / BCRC 11376 / JCM 18109 / NBRC 3775 / NCIMB 8073 / NRS 134) TaxID=446466 RepID=D5UG15_CELFN|nr:zinc-dependent alcohol dehydrogenase family protein [Cellulomonas flavigena]ADG75038.1 Alcohol dehydrogenase zinc-binding domain protein [Cellulomonas flavigena DSM 20109]
MRATVIHGPRDVRVEQVPDPVIHRPTDAVVRVVATCVCGSDLWGYRGVRAPGEPHRIGHEFVGVVEEVGVEVRRVHVGDFVVAPFSISDNTCVHCRHGVHTSCERAAWWGSPDHEGISSDAAQGEYVRVPLADGTLVVTPEHPDAALLPHVLTLTDVLGTGHHAALSAGVHAGSTVAVVGDGAVGLCGVIAARRLGAERIVAFSRHPARQALARRFGATDVVAERGDDGAAAVHDLLDGVGPDAVLECVGTKESMDQALATVRPGGRVGFVGVPAGGPELRVQTMFSSNKGVVGGVAPVRGYIEGLLPDVWAGTIEPGLVFDGTFGLDDIADAYRAMDERTVTKAFVLP